MIPLDKLLEPISADNPCGGDLFLDGSLMQLDVLIKTELDAEESEIEPDWPRVRQESLALAQRSKDLRVGVILCLALLKLEGLAGFREGLALLHGWADRFWDSLFPRLDAEDPEDPTRVFVFNNLSASLATETPYRFVKYLRQVPLCAPARLTAYALRDVLQADEQRSVEPSEGKPAATLEQIAASFRDTPADKLQKIHETVNAVRQAVEDLESLVAGRSSGGQGSNFSSIKQTLEAMRSTTAQYLTPSGGAPEATAAAAPGATAGMPGAPPRGLVLPGVLQSRAEVEAALRAAGDYFRRCEPSSPVPLLIERALRLMRLNFMEGMSELALGSTDDFKKLFGVSPSEPASETPSEPGS